MQPSSYDTHEAFELGIFAKTFRRGTVDEIFDAIAEHGLTCTQWNWACVPGFSSLPGAVPSVISGAVARAAARAGVRICAVSATFNLIDPAARELGLARLPALAHAALSVGCDLLTLCSGTRHSTDMWAYHPGNSSPEAWAGMMQGLRQASRIARRYGVFLGIEPETANVISDAASAEKAFDELGPDGDCFSIVLDAANLYRPPADPRVDPGIIDYALARLGRYVSLAHAKDIATFESGGNGHYTHVAAGTGILPYPHYLAALSRTPAARAQAANGRALPLILHGLEEEQVATSVTFVRNAIEALSRHAVL